LIGLAGSTVYLPAYGLLGLLSGLYAAIGMPLSMAAAVLSGGGYAAYVGGLPGFLSVVPEMTVTSLLLFVPLGRVSVDTIPVEEKEAACETRPETGRTCEMESIACLSGALSSVSERLKQAAVEERTPHAEDYERLCRLAQEHICRRCPGEGLCGERDAVEEALRAAVIRLSIGEGAGEGVVSPCEGYPKMIEEIRREAARLAQRKRQGGTKDVLSSDYALLSEMLREIAAVKQTEEEQDASAEATLRDALAAHGITADEINVRGKRHKRISLRGLHGTAGRTLEGEWVEDACVRACGRSVTGVKFSYDTGALSAVTESRRIFTVEGGTCTVAGGKGECAADRALTLTSGGGIAYAMLCDGMGSGKSAASAASLAASVLSDLLSADVSRAVALSLLNNAICASEEECSVALDLLSLDLYEGRACFLKSGAAASFVFRDGALFRIRSRTIPLGLLRIVDSEEASFEVRAGDMMVLLSDGVLGDNEEGGWLKDVLGEGGDSKTLAERIVENAVRRATSSDDKTAVVLRVQAAS
jgi:stage II sporulation protein E